MMNTNSVSIFSDPNIIEHNKELKRLELLYNNYVNEKLEIEKTLLEFQHQHTLELGEIIIKILKLRKEKFHNNEEKFKEAENDEKHYQSQFNEEKEKDITILNNDEKAELKKLFRKASILCHPDKVNEKYKKEAQEIFIQLKKAYDKNDIKKVNEILKNLENNNFKTNSETISKIENIKMLINQLEQKIERIISEIIEIQKSETYLTIISIKDWGKYFRKKKKELKKEYENLKKSE